MFCFLSATQADPESLSLTMTNWAFRVSIGVDYLEQRQQRDQIWLVTQRMVCFWRRRVHDKSATEYGAGWFALRGGEAALYVKNTVDLQWARSGENRCYRMILSEQCWISCTLFMSGRVFSRCGIWPKDIAGFGKTLTGCGIWSKGSAGFGKTLTLSGIWPKDRVGFGKTLTESGIWPKDSAGFGKTLTDAGFDC